MNIGLDMSEKLRWFGTIARTYYVEKNQGREPMSLTVIGREMGLNTDEIERIRNQANRAVNYSAFAILQNRRAAA